MDKEGGQECHENKKGPRSIWKTRWILFFSIEVLISVGMFSKQFEFGTGTEEKSLD